MSDITERPYLDTVVIPAALVFPGDTPPHMGFDTCRIPVRVVWRTGAPQTSVAAGGGSAGLFRGPPTTARAVGNPGGDEPAPGVEAAPELERAPSGGVSGADPVARFLRINEALDRMTGTAAAEMRGAGVAGTSRENVPVATTPVPVADDKVAATRGARSPEFFDRRALERVGYRTKNVNNSTARALGMSRTELRDAIHDLKRHLNLRGDDDLEIEVPSGDAFFNGENVGNLHDER